MTLHEIRLVHNLCPHATSLQPLSVASQPGCPANRLCQIDTLVQLAMLEARVAEDGRMTIKYQLQVLGPKAGANAVALETEVSTLFETMGLDFFLHGELLQGASKVPEWEGFPVAVWFGGPGEADPDEVDIAIHYLERGFSIFPVVDDLSHFSAHTPECLHPINGQPLDLKKIALDVMSGFRLSRRQRQAFISYKRSESSGVANQLFHELVERRFRPFLDTVSVDTGVNFQKSLWGRMADVDLLILLDSPTALDSRWVHEEFNRAHDLGMGVVQLIWPGHKRTPGTELSIPIQLADTDFENGDSSKSGILKPDVMEKVVDTIESARIRSLNARRTRLVESLLSGASAIGLSIQVHPCRQVDVLRGADKLAEVVPFVGIPDSIAVFEHEKGSSHETTFVVYNGLGVDEVWAEHLRWLNQKAKVEVFPIDDFSNQLESIK